MLASVSLKAVPEETKVVSALSTESPDCVLRRLQRTPRLVKSLNAKGKILFKDPEKRKITHKEKSICFRL